MRRAHHKIPQPTPKRWCNDVRTDEQAGEADRTPGNHGVYDSGRAVAVVVVGAVVVAGHRGSQSASRSCAPRVGSVETVFRVGRVCAVGRGCRLRTAVRCRARIVKLRGMHAGHRKSQERESAQKERDC